MAKGSKKRAFGLIRVSTSEQDFQSQKDELMKIAESYGYSIVDNSEGNDFFSEKISGYDDFDQDRESIVMLRHAIQLNRPDAIFIWELSRLTRNATKVSKYINELSLTPKIPMYFADYRLWTINPDTGDIDNNAVMQIQGGAMAVQMERERIKERTSRGRNAKAEKGYYVGHLKDGYLWKEDANGEKVIHIDTERKPTILKIFELYLDQEKSTRDIRDYLNAHIEQHPTPNRYRYLHPAKFKGYRNEYIDRSGNILRRDEILWTDSTVCSILRDEWYAGTRYYRGKPYAIEPIISRERWEACKNRLARFHSRTSTAKQPYLLASLVYCGICGRKMYGHSDGGYNDMYYCSSYEYGKNNSCGLKWIRRQNLESILANIIISRAYNDITLGEHTPFSDFFSADKAKIKSLDSDIDTYRQLNKRAKKQIEDYDNQIAFYIQMQGKNSSNQLLVNHYQKQIDETLTNIEKMNLKITEYQINIDKIKKQKRKLSSTSQKILSVSSMEDYTNLKALMNHVINRIYLYNPDSASTVIEIHYVNGKTDLAIYSPTLLHKKYIFVSKEYETVAPFIKYDKASKLITFKGYYLAIGNNQQVLFNSDEDFKTMNNGISLGTWDTPQNRQRFITEAAKANISPDKAHKIYEKAVEDHILWKSIDDAITYFNLKGAKVFKDEITVQEYIDAKKNDTLQVFEFDDLLPMPQRGVELKERAKEYNKRHNTGKPSSVPYIDKDIKYDQIQRERKHLYNRKYKILKNKHLSQDQKAEQILQIQEKLEAFKYQLRYLPTNKKGKQCIARYKSTESSFSEDEKI